MPEEPVDSFVKEEDNNDEKVTTMPVEQLATAGDFCLSGNLQHGSVNLWSRVVGLVRIGHHNFFNQMHQIKHMQKSEAKEAAEKTEEEVAEDQADQGPAPES